MLTSLAWLNRLIDRPITADEAEHALTFAGFPIESRKEAPGGDTILDVEVTSNRGDVLCHLGVAREVCAATGRALRPPAVADPSTLEGSGPCPVEIVNEDHAACPLFTATVVRGVKVGPSPDWLRNSLDAIGQRSINNVVDASNYVLHEIGQPSHAFDLARLSGKRLSVRSAADGEHVQLLDGGRRPLKKGDWVIADHEGAASLAGIMGGATSAVTDATTDLLIEVATWRPVMIRLTARRLMLRTDASHRYERWVPPATIEQARRRLVSLILELSGGRVDGGAARVGAPVESPRPITARAHRIRAVLGIAGAGDAAFDDAALERALKAQGIAITSRPSPVGAVFDATPPAHRPDIRIEEDIIEEAARTIGYGHIPVLDRMGVRVEAPQAAEVAERRLADTLTGLGFFETLTFSFTSPKLAAHWLVDGVEAVSLPDERRGSEPTLRPSLLTGLLTCRHANQNARVRQDGGVRLFEIAAVYGQSPGTRQSIERRHVALVLDVPATGGKEHERKQAAVRLARGAVEAMVTALGGPGAAVQLGVQPSRPPQAGWDPDACAAVSIRGTPVGVLGLISRDTQRAHDLASPVAAAEINLDALLALYPPAATARELPRFPPVEKDITVVVDEHVAWSAVAGVIDAARPSLPALESSAFVGVFRDPSRAGSKNVTFRLTFRDPARTLTNEEVDAAVERFKHDAIPQVGRPLEAVARG